MPTLKLNISSFLSTATLIIESFTTPKKIQPNFNHGISLVVMFSSFKNWDTLHHACWYSRPTHLNIVHARQMFPKREHTEDQLLLSSEYNHMIAYNWDKIQSFCLKYRFCLHVLFWVQRIRCLHHSTLPKVHIFCYLGFNLYFSSSLGSFSLQIYALNKQLFKSKNVI